MAERRLKIIFRTEDEHERVLVSDYWKGEHDGRRWNWEQSAEYIAFRFGLSTSQLIVRVKAAAQVIDETVLCIDCGKARLVGSRSEVVSSVKGQYRCDTCIREIRARESKERQKREDERTARRRTIVEAVRAARQTFDYGEIEYLDAMLVYSIMVTSDEACERGTFNGSAAAHLSPSGALSGKFLARLLDRGILRFASGVDQDAIELSDEGRWFYYPLKMNWEFVPDSGGDSFHRIMSRSGQLIELRDLHPEFSDSVRELWWSLAYDDALQFLLAEVEKYRLPELREGPKTREALRHALKHFSIPQVRRKIMHVVKNAAALSASRDFHARHAMNTIPGNLISFIDRAVSEGWEVYPAPIDWTNGEPVLLKLLFERVLQTGLPGFKSLNGEWIESEYALDGGK